MAEETKNSSVKDSATITEQVAKSNQTSLLVLGGLSAVALIGIVVLQIFEPKNTVVPTIIILITPIIGALIVAINKIGIVHLQTNSQLLDVREDVKNGQDRQDKLLREIANLQERLLEREKEALMTHATAPVGETPGVPFGDETETVEIKGVQPGAGSVQADVIINVTEKKAAEEKKR